MELSSSYVEMGLEISFATVIREIPSLTIRKVEFLSMDHLFKPGNISAVMRKEKNLISYKSDFIKILFGEEITGRAI